MTSSRRRELSLAEQVPAAWATVLGPAELDALAGLDEFLVEEHRGSFVVYPPRGQIFAALELTPIDSVRAVILGQDPYPKVGQAHGLAFSVPDGVPIPGSLRSILRAVSDDMDAPVPLSGSLEPWARHGVLLLNSVLTVRAGAAGSHGSRGWEVVSKAIVAAVAERRDHVAFLLWGQAARKVGHDLDRDRHVVLETTHPSPRSAYRGFLDAHHFKLANEGLRRHGVDPIDWTL